MRCVYLYNGRVDVRSAELPSRPPGHARLRLLAAGICNTDLELQRGYYGFSGVPGHEFVAEVVDADSPALLGKRVAGEINLGCGQCEFCRHSLSRHCSARTVLGIVRHAGAFQDCFTLPERNLHVLPERIPTEHGVFIEPLAAACEILEQVAIPCGARVAVLGDGKLGLLTALALLAYGYRVEHFGHHPEKLAISRRAGACVHAGGEPGSRQFDWVVEATGSPAGLDAAVRITRPRGSVFLKSTVRERSPIDAAAVIVNEISLIGSRCGRFEPAIELLALGAVEIAPLITARYRLDEAPQAFAHAAAPGALKILLAP